MLDQASTLRQLAEKNYKDDFKNENRTTRILTITSGKGGVGKSNIVVNLGITLQKMGKKVLIFDADVGMGNDDVLIGCFPKYNIFDVIFNNKNIEDVIIEGPLGIKLLPGGSGLSRVDDLTEIQRKSFLNKLENIEGFDYILMDTGAGINRSVLGFIACSDEFIVVTTPEPTSLTDAYSLIKAVSHFKIKDNGSVIINRVLDEEEGLDTFTKFSKASSKFLNLNLNFLGMVSEDVKLVKSVRTQKPLCINYPNSEAAKNIESIAERLEGLVLREHNLGVQRLFKKIFSIFS
ncbi:MAG: MinD/ParA family protein [Clostridium argentinense]|uniref:MinD/ParA family protein n=1 Tax=Clostridium faecium TaxID=2762223 RepID=A0ABR8YRD9_9CLOT|nr:MULTISPECIES: MinD/ParA family protein [Clostridium]MBD8046449.1 MinD/ParA family protein [Clostridium faecium]MBS5824298.1 MinD/ParA family protein [Clostridium argentinense]MDU1348962.1 MinD/ParA family protein [Clostridium argentinense]